MPKMRQIRFPPGSAQDPARGAYDVPHTSSRLGKGNALPIPHHLDAYISGGAIA